MQNEQVGSQSKLESTIIYRSIRFRLQTFNAEIMNDSEWTQSSITYQSLWFRLSQKQKAMEK